MVRPADVRPARQAVHEGSDIFGREAEDEATLDRGETAIAAGRILECIVRASFKLHSHILVEIARPAHDDACVGRLVGLRENDAVRLQNLYGALRSEVTIARKDVPA